MNKMPSLKQLNSEINKIKTRNKKVEFDKAWETSTTRKIIIALLTYLIIVSCKVNVRNLR